ncbi:esterase-like activity of phytase family protein [Phenylobacterium aquaticum]|uniref:esterase-like activity of phytase family protein n=1 Tax=Phenylobacterium aquaticum TaxID=1763816 RepID=UPI001F5CD62C|nr:esterase-like activity of phytase family protein [Phenylobacterium aquaticum]
MIAPPLRRWGGIFAALALCACSQPPTALPKGPMAAGPHVTVTAEAVPLNTKDPAQDRLGNFAYAGGLALTSNDTARLHGLSDLKVLAGNRIVSESDEGDLLEARLMLDAKGRLTGLADARMSVLHGPDGEPLQGKNESDAEGIAVLPDGDRLVSFEEDDRILLYPAKGGAPHVVNSPNVVFRHNLGMEALAADPSIAPDAYRVGQEDTGQTWICRLSAPCVADRKIDVPLGSGLTAMAPLPQGRIAYLIRAWDPWRGSRVTLLVLDAQGAQVDRAEFAPPLTVDNFEGLGAVAKASGQVRFYLISDDNFSAKQRTLLLALDWTPPAR